MTSWTTTTARGVVEALILRLYPERPDRLHQEADLVDFGVFAKLLH